MLLSRYFGQDQTGSEPPHNEEKSKTDDQMKRVAEIMQASTESTIQMLSDIFNN